MTSKKRIIVLGATGSIGENALRVIAAHPESLELVGIAAHSNHVRLGEIVRRFGVPRAALRSEEAARAAGTAGSFPSGVRLSSGIDGLCELCALPEADLVLVAMVGTEGLRPTLAAIEAGKDIALANKEILVLAGKFVTAAARRRQVALIPVDSEHNAIFQCLQGSSTRQVAKIYITASGGTFREASLETLAKATPAEALRHPNWSMGPKITVDSATLANKGLELIEAQWLFGLRPDQIEAVVHPQSIVHALVRFVDGSILAQLSPPSMTFAIQHALLFPDRAPGVDPSLDFSEPLRLDFHPPDYARFPCLRLARAAMELGGVAPALFNAANEMAVEGFLAERLRFLEIHDIIDKTLSRIPNFEPATLEDVLQADRLARQTAGELISRR